LKPLKLPKEDKDLLIDELQGHLEMEHDMTLGRLATEQLVEFMLQQLSAPIYNQAVEDARAVLMERMATLEDDLYALKRSKSARR